MTTLGEKRVCHTFNPSGNAPVDFIKSAAVHLINYVNDIPNTNDQTARWKATAMTEIETGAMYAVKAATAGQDQDQEQEEESDESSHWNR